MPGSIFRNRTKYMHCYTLTAIGIGTLQPCQTAVTEQLRKSDARGHELTELLH